MCVRLYVCKTKCKFFSQLCGKHIFALWGCVQSQRYLTLLLFAYRTHGEYIDLFCYFVVLFLSMLLFRSSTIQMVFRFVRGGGKAAKTAEAAAVKL